MRPVVQQLSLQAGAGNAEIYNELGLCEMAKRVSECSGGISGGADRRNSLMQTLCFNEIVAYEYLEDYQQAEVLINLC